MGGIVEGIAAGLVAGGISTIFGKKNKTKVNSSAASDLAQDKIKNASKRKNLYSTVGGALGQEVTTVMNNSRNNLFGN